ncbi:hypothetical protein QN277_014010 [Acacia crassicarpa]|uniref:Uncharacterized protein n=2 Tax=Acacia crassicarpa TaxID=499986 RepID=A0AAE1N605_9FABA|nr:hypothetical protein QN277_014010 [Acacia crassicarpa]
MPEMGFHYFGERRMRRGYDRLTSCDDQKMSRSNTTTRRWIKCLKGRLRGFRLLKCKKVSVKAISAVLISSKIVRMYSDIVNRLNLETVRPAIVLSTQWGLPVLSHPSVICRNSVAPISRKVTSYY